MATWKVFQAWAILRVMLCCSSRNAFPEASRSSPEKLSFERRSTSERRGRSTSLLYVVTVLCDSTGDVDRGRAPSLDALTERLSDNVRSMMESPFHYRVDVYWIMSCPWEHVLEREYFIKADDGHRDDDRFSRDLYLRDRLPDGVGLQVWEDAMPLEYFDGDTLMEKPGDGAAVDETTLTANGLPDDGEDGNLPRSERERPRQSSTNLRSDVDLTSLRGLAPSLNELLKRHRYVVRDKLQHYDLFLSFAASLNASKDDENALERITGDHVDAHLRLSSEIDAWKRRLPPTDGAPPLPGLLTVRIRKAHEPRLPTFDDAGFDPSPCCAETTSSVLPSPSEIVMAGTSAKLWRFWNLTQHGDDPSGLDSWIAVERRRKASPSDEGPPFFENGWILTRERLLRLHRRSCPGAFLPPFRDSDDGRRAAVRRRWKGAISAPLYDAEEEGGCGALRAVSLRPSGFSRQLVRSAGTEREGGELVGAMEWWSALSEAGGDMRSQGNP